MLVAHLVPGYLAASLSRERWRPEWSKGQRLLLWGVALGSTVAPDLDVVYNTLFRGFINHSTLWTHSLFIYLGIAMIWWLLYRTRRWPFPQTFVGLVAVGGMSHLALDAFSHSTPLLYPVSMSMVGVSSDWVLAGGFWAYITDPIILAEPCLLALAAAYWISGRNLKPRTRSLALMGLGCGLALFSAMFMAFLPLLQEVVINKGIG